MSSRHAIYLTMRRELRERLRSRAFQVATAVQILILVGIVIVAGVTGDDTETFKVGAVGERAASVGELARTDAGSIEAKIELETLADEAAAESAVSDEDVEAAILDDRLLTGSSPDPGLIALLQDASAQVRGSESLRAEGLSEEQVRATLQPPPLEVTELGSGAAGEGIAFVGVLLLYIAILTFGISVAVGVVEEKSSRVVEVILSAIRPFQLLAGKVLGIGLLGLLQVAVIAGVGVAVSLLNGAVELPQSTASTVVLVAVYFILGYLLYACAFAAAGAIVSRQEDVNSATAPLSLLLVAGYLASFSAIGTPDSTAAVVLTFVPPIAPMVVPARAAQDALPAAELIGSLILMVVAIAAMLWIAARIYDRAVLRMGAPLKLRQALRLMRERAPALK